MGRESRTVEQLQKCEELFRRVFANAPFGICVAGLDGNILRVNAALCRMVGYSEDEMLATVWGELDHPDDVGPSLEKLEQLLPDPSGWAEGEKRYIHRDGSVVWGRMRASLARDGEGKPLYFVVHAENITERKRVAEALHESEARFRIMADGCPTVMWVTNAEGGIQFINRAYREFCGITYEEAEGGNWQFLAHPDDVSEHASQFQRAVQEHTTFKAEVRLRRADGEWRWVASYAEPRFSSSGEFLGHVGLSPDITERKQVEAELRWNTAFLEAQGNATVDGILVVDANGKRIFQNEQCLKLWKTPKNIGGHRSDAPSLKYGVSLVKDPDKFLKRVQYLYDHPDETSRDEIELRDGKVLDRYSAPVLGKDGERYGRVWAFRDITDRRRNEDALRASEERFRLVVEGAPLGILIQAEGIFRYINPAALAMFGAESADQIVGHSVFERIHPESRAAVLERIRILKEEGKAVPFLEEQLVRLDGTIFDVEATARRFLFEGHEGSIVFVGDITERKREERALRESEERFRLVVESAPLGMYIATDGLFRYLNPAALAMFGADGPDKMIGECCFDRVHPDSRDEVTERARLLKEERRTAPFLEEQHLRMDGSAIDTEVTAIPFIFKGRDGAIVFVRDITERKREEDLRRGLEQQLRQAQKMEAVGRLAGGIAHDFNNLLMVIQSYAEMLQNSLPAHDPLRRKTRQILKAAERGASLTGRMLAFSRKQIISPVVLDLNAVINETAKMLKRIIGEDIELQVGLAESLWAIEADPDQIVQVLMNLCVNSRDAMPRGGTLTIATQNVTLADGNSGVHAHVSPGHYVMLAVTDTGTVISKELQEEIFEPFFTTKEVGKGTGLGLASVYGIVKQSGGYVWVDSELGQGARFTIYLPKVKRPVAPNGSAKTNAPRGTETLLVVEDEEFIREGICEFLRSLGYTVFSASSGQEALVVASQQEHIDLLLTDVVMPKMSGRELSQMLEGVRPDLKVIHMSGYTDDTVLRHGIHKSNASFLQKPFSLGTLARKLRDTLGQTDIAQRRPRP